MVRTRRPRGWVRSGVSSASRKTACERVASDSGRHHVARLPVQRRDFNLGFAAVPKVQLPGYAVVQIEMPAVQGQEGIFRVAIDTGAAAGIGRCENVGRTDILRLQRELAQ